MRAIETFRTLPYLHNCAQAIANRWHHLFSEGDAIVGIYAPYKGGLAPGGLCGALYAAMQARPDKKEEIISIFKEKVGATHCKEIKTLTKTSCHTCVNVADTIIESYESD